MIRTIFTIALLLAFGVVSAQQKTVKDTLVYKYAPRYFNPAPCGCYSPKKDSTYVKKETLKPSLDIVFVRRKEKRRF